VIGMDPGGLFGAETTEIVQQFIAQTGITFPVAWDQFSYSAFRAAGGGGVAPFPLDVVIDQNGTVAYVSREYQAAAMQAVIESLLAK